MMQVQGQTYQTLHRRIMQKDERLVVALIRTLAAAVEAGRTTEKQLTKVAGDAAAAGDRSTDRQQQTHSGSGMVERAALARR